MCLCILVAGEDHETLTDAADQMSLSDGELTAITTLEKEVGFPLVHYTCHLLCRSCQTLQHSVVRVSGLQQDGVRLCLLVSFIPPYMCTAAASIFSCACHTITCNACLAVQVLADLPHLPNDGQLGCRCPLWLPYASESLVAAASVTHLVFCFFSLCTLELQTMFGL